LKCIFRSLETPADLDFLEANPAIRYNLFVLRFDKLSMTKQKGFPLLSGLGHQLNNQQTINLRAKRI
jgi:hypothetical protein